LGHNSFVLFDVQQTNINVHIAQCGFHQVQQYSFGKDMIPHLISFFGGINLSHFIIGKSTGTQIIKYLFPYG
jgi:hypothetical protein